MVDFAVIEITIFVLSVPFVLYFITSSLMVRALAASAAVSIMLEIVNERFFPLEGTYYPKSLIFFPFFNFPVAIIFLAVLYSGLINLISLKISEIFVKKILSVITFFVSVLVLNSLSIYIERAGIYSGYWVHRQPAGISGIHGYVYLFYSLIVLAGSLFIVSGSLKKFKKTDQHF
ncbi:MAG TPA: hypothetical protein PLX56_12195 [bacterium]|nr:hypothetical protein [bacterium]